MARVLMLNPPFLPRFSRSQRSPGVIRSGTLYYPMWLAYATGALERAGHQVTVLDAPARGMDRASLLALVESVKPGLVVVDTSTPSIYNDAAVAGEIGERVPDALVALVGTHVSALPEESLRLCARVDAVARREYDWTVCELADVVDGRGALEDVNGITFRSRRCREELVSTADRPPAAGLDVLPFVSDVYRRHLRIEDYCYSITRHPVVALVTGRGCSHGCAFCVYPQTMHGRKYRRRSVANVVAELEYIERELPQVREVFIEDDTLTQDAERCGELCREIVRAGICLPWSANSRADVDGDTLHLMRRAGCRLLCVGFESGDQAVLDSIGKHIRVEAYGLFMSDARRAGIMVHGCFMVGNRGETRETMDKTLALARRLQPDTAQFLPLMVYPGTPAFEWASGSGLLTTTDFARWLNPDGFHNCVVSPPCLTAEELVAFCDHARRSFYLRPSYIAGKAIQAATHPDERERLVRGFRRLGPHLRVSRGAQR